MSDYRHSRRVVYQWSGPGWLAFAVYFIVGFLISIAVTGNVVLSLLLAVIWPIAMPFLLAATGLAVIMGFVLFFAIIAGICWLLAD